METADAHPDFSLEIEPRARFVYAFAQHSEGESDYVSAAYTAKDPSSGQPIQYIIVEPENIISNLVINDWHLS